MSSSSRNAPSFPERRHELHGAGINQSGFIPPDTQGAAGPTRLVETINGSFSVIHEDRPLISQTSLDSFFNTALRRGRRGHRRRLTRMIRASSMTSRASDSSSRATTTPTP